ncbi:UNVERIFIED_CONTAM: hypothetical protein FKN15_028824 [Acipenser sinensis]
MPKSPLDPHYKRDATFQWDHPAKNNKQLDVFQGLIVNDFSTGTDPAPSMATWRRSKTGAQSTSTQWEDLHRGRSSSCHFSPQFHNLQELRRSASLATKVFIQRDYTEGTTCQFQTKFPAELDSRIERQLFEDTVKTLNNYYAEAEKIGGQSYLEGCLACVTAYIIFMCMETRYEKIERQLFEDTVKTLNNYYAEAEKIGGQSYLEGCLACVTAYIIFMCMETRYEKVRPCSCGEAPLLTVKIVL